MSRNYQYQLELDFTQALDVATVKTLINEHAELDVECCDGPLKDDNRYVYTLDGTCTLAGGEHEEEAHERIVAALKKASTDLVGVTSRWHCLEMYEWDDVFETELGSEET